MSVSKNGLLSVLSTVHTFVQYLLLRTSLSRLAMFSFEKIVVSRNCVGGSEGSFFQFNVPLGVAYWKGGGNSRGDLPLRIYDT